MARWNPSNQILRCPLCCAIGERSPRSKKQRRSRACKARNEAHKKMMSGRSGFIGDGAERFAGPFVTMRRSRKQDAARVEQLRGHTAKPKATTSTWTKGFSRFSRRCVGGDVHPVGVRRQLNDPWIFGRLIIVTISPAQPGRVSAEVGACGAKRNQPASKSRQCTSTALRFFSGGSGFCGGRRMIGDCLARWMLSGRIDSLASIRGLNFTEPHGTRVGFSTRIILWQTSLLWVSRRPCSSCSGVDQFLNLEQGRNLSGLSRGGKRGIGVDGKRQVSF